MAFTKAEKKQAKLRLALIGPSGSGKTYTALAIAKGLGQRIAVIDTEHASASLYADLFEFDTQILESFSAQEYKRAIKEAEASGYDVLVIDSLSHAWAGKDGILEFVDLETSKSNRGDGRAAWRKATPQHNLLVEAMLATKMHLIITMRTKTEYVTEKDERGKMVMRKVGLQPVQRDGLEYEFTVTADLDMDNNLDIGKTRCHLVFGKRFPKAGKELADILMNWLNSGAVPVVTAHWIEDDTTRKGFWKWVHDQGADEAMVHTALGVASMLEYKGSKSDAAKAITQYLKDHPKQPDPAVQNPPAQTTTPEPHWASKLASVKPFKEHREKLGITTEQVMEILGVKKLTDCKLDIQAAIKLLDAWTAKGKPAPTGTPALTDPIGEAGAQQLAAIMDTWLLELGIKQGAPRLAVVERFLFTVTSGEMPATNLTWNDFKRLSDPDQTRFQLVEDAASYLEENQLEIPPQVAEYIAEVQF